MKTIQQARIYAAKINRELASHAFDDDFGFASHVTDEDKHKYVAKQLRYAEQIERGDHDNNFTIWQRMNYYLTGDCVPFFSKPQAD